MVHHIYGTRGITYSFQVGIYHIATNISVHNTNVCHLQTKETYSNQPEIYFVDNDAEYVLFVVFGCMRYSLKLSEMNYGFLDNQIYFHIVFISYDT